MILLHGFEFIAEQHIPEINTQARLWRHQRTGAQLLSMENQDENKVFGITFRTPPPDFERSAAYYGTLRVVRFAEIPP